MKAAISEPGLEPRTHGHTSVSGSGPLYLHTRPSSRITKRESVLLNN